MAEPQLDALVRDVMETDDVVIGQVPDGRQVTVTKGEASLKFTLFDDGHVFCSHLSSPGGGWLVAANRLVTEVAPLFGGTSVEIEVDTDEARDTLLKYAPYEPVDGKPRRYRWEL